MLKLHRYPLSSGRRTVAAALAFVVAAVGAAFVEGQVAPIPSRNVNVISGTGPAGDWTLQRQNEPSMACSSRNPLNCLAGANDYRSVDIPFPPDGGRVIGDAWLGWYTTKDGGQTWRTRLLPGFPQDQSAAGLSSPLKAYDAGADPVVRAGAHGMLFYAGIAFRRGPGGGSTLFVSRFIDNNNQEHPGGESIAYLDTIQVMRAPHGTVTNFFIDKPWLAVDVPRPGARTCTVGGQSGVPQQRLSCSRVFLAFTVFQGSGTAQRGTVLFTYSDDSGVTWSSPQPISAPPDVDVSNDGIVDSRDLQVLSAANGAVCQTPQYVPDADVNIDCVVNGQDFAAVARQIGRRVAVSAPVHQGATLAVVPETGALRAAWREFRFGGRGLDQIQAAVSNDGRTFSAPVVVAGLAPFDQTTQEGHFRSNAYPSLAVDGAGRGYLVWATRGLATARRDPTTGDARIVVSTSGDGLVWSPPEVVDETGTPGHQFMPALSFAASRLQLIYYDQREDRSQVFGPFIDETQVASIRHTTDVVVAQADPGASPRFVTARASDYRVGVLPGQAGLQQFEFHPPNLPMFRLGTVPFIGDYIDVAPAQSVIFDGSRWRFNTTSADSPVFHALWTDNRDVRPPPNNDWTVYTPPIPSFPRPVTSSFDPAQRVPECTPGFVATRNQNVYGSRITEGLFAAALGNAKALNGLQRAFATYVQNSTGVTRSYRLSTSAPVGATASFQQFEQLTVIDVRVPARSTVARTVFVSAVDARATIRVLVEETSDGSPLPDGQRATIVLNPDPTNPDVDNPDVDNPDVDNVEIETPDVGNAEVYNPDVDNGVVVGQANPDVDNPDVDNPDVDNVVVENPSVLSTNVVTPDVDNPDVDNPDVDNPDVDNFDLVNGALSDTTWELSNRGNTSATYSVKLLLRQPLPAGFRSQLLAHRTYKTPMPRGCELKVETANILLLNLPNPQFFYASTATSAALRNAANGARMAPQAAEASAVVPSDDAGLDDVTVAIAPGDVVRLTLRVFDPNRFDDIVFSPLAAVVPVLQAHAVDTVAAQNGSTTPALAMPLVGSAALPAASPGAAYSTTLVASGPGTWSLAGGELPAGLSLSPEGIIAGTATAGTLTQQFTVKFAGADGAVDYQRLTLQVAPAAALADLSVDIAAAPVPGLAGTPTTYSIVVSNHGTVDAFGVTVEQILPLGASFVSATGSGAICAYSTRVRCSLPTLAASATETITVVASATASGQAGTTVTVRSDTPDAVVGNNVATLSTTIHAFAACSAPSFHGPFLYPTGQSGTFQIGVGELNGDAYHDAVVASSAAHSLQALAGTGGGSFGPPVSLALGQPPQGITLADFDENGHLDIVTTSADGVNVLLFRGVGAGAFLPAQVSSIGDNAFVVDSADMNNDANLDLVIGTSTGKLLMMSGDGRGGFGAPVVTLAHPGATSASPVRVVIEDFNQDGLLDVAVSVVGNVRLLHNQPQNPGTFDVLPAFSPGINPRVRKVGDVNLDGRPDLAVSVSNAPTGQTLIYLGASAGVFTGPFDAMTGQEGIQPTAADVTGDGLPDLVVGHGTAGLSVQVGAGDGTFAAPVRFAGVPTDIPKVIDLNGDRRPDLLLSGGQPAYVQVFMNNCAATGTDLAVATTASVGPVTAGAPVEYHATITNASATAASSVLATFSLPFESAVQAASPSQGTCGIVAPNLVRCELGTVAPSTGVTVDVTAALYSGGRPARTITLTAASADADPTPGNKSGHIIADVTAVPLSFVVTSSANEGGGTLRRAIELANANAAADSITFNIPGEGPHVISLLTALPAMTNRVTLDAESQPGYSASVGPSVILDGAAVFGTAHGLNVVNGQSETAAGSIIRGVGLRHWRGAGIRVATASGLSTQLTRNAIGADAFGLSAYPNGIGISIENGAQVSIGESVVGDGNLIAFNSGVGIRVLGNASATILRNRIFGNGGLGIDLGGDGVTANDSNDADAGPNTLQNFPEIGAAASDGVSTTVTGSIQTTPNLATLPLLFFLNSSCDGSGYGEGEIFLGSDVGSTDASGVYVFTLEFFEDGRGKFITATAGTASSEFSACVPVAVTP